MEELHILWISEGMSCDGDTVSITAAMQPSIEDVVLGRIPGLPKVHLHNKVLAYETGEDFVEAFRRADRGELGPFVLVIEGSIPNENINGEGYWTSFGNDEQTGLHDREVAQAHRVEQHLAEGELLEEPFTDRIQLHHRDDVLLGRGRRSALKLDAETAADA